jgi:hypothetical protein
VKSFPQKHDVDLAVAMAFYANGIPFNVVRNRYFIRAVRMIAKHGLGYKLPGYDRLRKELLMEVSVISACL